MQTMINLLAALLIILLWLQLREQRKSYLTMRDLCFRMEKTIDKQTKVNDHYKTVIKRLWEQLPDTLSANPNLDFAHPSRMAMDEAFMMKHIVEDPRD